MVILWPDVKELVGDIVFVPESAGPCLGAYRFPVLGRLFLSSVMPLWETGSGFLSKQAVHLLTQRSASERYYFCV